MTADEIIGEGGQSIILAIGPAILDCRILALDIAGFAQTPTESGYAGGERYSRPAVEETDHRHRRLLRARHKRPRDGRAEERDELAPLHRCNHSITSSAMASNLSGTLSPSALAVLRLSVRSNLVGCMTGRSAGLSPLRIRPT